MCVLLPNLDFLRNLEVKQLLHCYNCCRTINKARITQNRVISVTTQSFDIGTRFQGRAIKFSPPLKTFAQKSYFVVPCLK